MALVGIEAIIDLVKDYFTTNMAAKLTALDAEYGDSITLTTIAAYYVAEVLEVPELPAIFFLGDASNAQEVSGTGHSAELYEQHTIRVVCFATEANPETLRRQLYRYVRAAVELISDGMADDTFNWHISALDRDYSPLLAQESTFLADARLTITLELVES